MARDVEEGYEVWMAAFAGLVESRNYFEISVSEIADAAGMSRVSFYNYFTDKEELLWKTYRHLFLDVENRVASIDPVTLLSEGKPLTYYVFENVKQHRRFYRSLFCTGMPPGFQQKMFDYVCQESHRTHAALRARYKRTDFPYLLINEYLTGALFAVIRSMLHQEADWDSASLAEFFTALAGPGLIRMLDQESN